jgi:hypothetical protein
VFKQTVTTGDDRESPLAFGICSKGEVDFGGSADARYRAGS